MRIRDKVELDVAHDAACELCKPHVLRDRIGVTCVSACAALKRLRGQQRWAATRRARQVKR